MLKKKSLLFLAALLAVIALIVLMTACATTRTEYVYTTPDIPAFPVFPAPDCVEYDADTDTVFMPLWYWQKIAEYKIDVDAIQTYLDRLDAAGKPETKE